MTASQNHSLIIIAIVLLGAVTPLGAADLPEDPPKGIVFEARLASLEEAEGWERVAGPKPDQAIWVAPEPVLTNADIERAWPERMNGQHCVGLLLTEEGALALATLTKKHIGEMLALMVDGEVTAAPRIAAPITGGRAILQGNFTEEEAIAIAAGITGN
jgi:preprotein translocase subunit SecD